MMKMKVLNKILVLLVIIAIVLAKKKKATNDRQKIVDEIQENQGTHEVTVEITKENVEELKQKTQYLLALLVTSDRSSLKLMVDYPQLHHNLKENGIEDFTLGLVDHEGYPEFAQEHGVKKVPALVLISQNGQQIDIYKGMNYVEDMFNWVHKTIKTPRTTSLLIQNFEQLSFRVKQFDIFVLFFGTNPNTPEFKQFESLASKRKDFVFAHTFDKECREENGYRDPEQQGLVLYNKREQELNMNYINHYKGDLLNTKEISTFLKIFSTKAIQMVRPWDTSKINEGSIPKLILALNQYDYFGSKSLPEDLMTPEELTFLDLRPKLLNKVFLNILNVTETNREEVRAIFELPENYTIPKVFFIQPVPQKPPRKYIFSGEKINVDSMMKFVQDIKKGKIKPIAQQEEPISKEIQDTLLVKSVAADNWEELVINNNKDVLVFFYSLECHPCNDMIPTYHNLAYRLRHNPNLVLARVNIGNNDIPSVIVKKTPEFKFYKANMKDQPINFIYTNKPSAILEAMKQEVSHPWVKPIPESEVDPKEVKVYYTDLEIKWKRDEKQRNEESARKQRQEMEAQGIDVDELNRQADLKKLKDNEEVQQTQIKYERIKKNPKGEKTSEEVEQKPEGKQDL